MNKVEKIKQEIERLKHNTPNAYDLSRFMLLEEIESFIDSLPKESGCEVNFTTKSEDLEEELRRILNEHYYFPDEDDELRSIPDLAKYIAYHFAEWQKEKDKQLVGATQKISHQHGYDEGRAAVREEMMKVLIGGEVVKDIHNQLSVESEPLNDTFRDVKFGDKVKIVIIQED